MASGSDDAGGAIVVGCGSILLGLLIVCILKMFGCEMR
jgi:threonine dehydrogenase-like Zn-dependent dehydrogenase